MGIIFASIPVTGIVTVDREVTGGVDIQKATAAAMATGLYITRAGWEGTSKIEPTNTPACCMIHVPGKEPFRGWEPDARDLLALDWQVTD